MSKKIPIQLKRRILIALGRATEPLPSSYFADVSKDLKPSMHRSPTQITMMLKQLRKDHPEIESVDLAKNGISQTGQQRTRKGWHAPTLCLTDDADIILPEERPALKKVSVNLPPDCVAHLTTMKATTGMSPGRVFVDLLRADMQIDEDDE